MPERVYIKWNYYSIKLQDVYPATAVPPLKRSCAQLYSLYNTEFCMETNNVSALTIIWAGNFCYKLLLLAHDCTVRMILFQQTDQWISYYLIC